MTTLTTASPSAPPKDKHLRERSAPCPLFVENRDNDYDRWRRSGITQTSNSSCVACIP
jgi:hypothetical protein